MGQDSEGFSSILLPSANLNIDGSNNVITLSFAQLLKSNSNSLETKNGLNIDAMLAEFNFPLTTKNKKKFDKKVDDFKKENSESLDHSWLLGVELKGKSSNGLSIIFNDEILSTQATVLGVVGYQWTNKSYNKRLIDEYTGVYNPMAKNEIELDEYLEEIEKSLKVLVVNHSIYPSKSGQILNRLKNGDKEDRLEGVRQSHNDIEKLDFEKLKSKRISEIKKQIDLTKSILDKCTIVTNLFPKEESEQSEIKGSEKKIESSSESSNKISEENLKLIYKYRTQILNDIEVIKTSYSLIESFEWEKDLSNFKERKNWIEFKKALEDRRENLNLKSDLLEELKDTQEAPISNLIKFLNSYKGFLESSIYLSKRKKALNANLLHYNRHIIYAKGGFSGTSFKYDLDNGGSDISQRFENRDFQGNRFEFGYTRQHKTVNYFGFNFSKDYTDNSSSLTSTTYEFKTMDDTVTPNLEVSQKFEALTGPYDRFDQYQLSADYVRMLPLRDSNKPESNTIMTDVYLNINPYIRHRFYNDSSSLKPNTDVGLGLYAFNVNKNSIAGGFFIQGNDIFNSNRPRALNFTKQLSIGLIFKYALKSFNPTD